MHNNVSRLLLPPEFGPDVAHDPIRGDLGEAAAGRVDAGVAGHARFELLPVVVQPADDVDGALPLQWFQGLPPISRHSTRRSIGRS